MLAKELHAPGAMPARNSFLMATVLTAVPPCNQPAVPPCNGLSPCNGHDSDWSAIPEDDQKILRPCYGCAPISEGGNEVEKQPRVSMAASHQSDGMVSYGAVPERGVAIDDAPAGGAIEYGEPLPNDWETLQRLHSEGKIKIHDDNEQDVQATHEEVEPGVFRAVDQQEVRQSADSRYSYYDQAAGGNNLQINMMHEVPQMDNRHSHTSAHRESRNSDRRESRNSARRESRNSHRGSRNSAREEVITETTKQVIVEEQDFDEGKRHEVAERRGSREDNDEVRRSREEDEAPKADREEEDDRRTSRRSKKRTSRSRRRRSKGKSRRRWFR